MTKLINLHNGRMRKRMPVMLIIGRGAGVAVMVLAAVLQACVTERDPEPVSLMPGDRLPEFSVELNTGERATTSRLRGKTVVIEFFNTSCPDCRRSLPELQGFYEEYKGDSRVAIFAISRSEGDASVEKYWNENAFTMPYSAQEDADVYHLFASSGIPRLYVADASGIIVAAYGEADVPDADSLSEIISRLLGE